MTIESSVPAAMMFIRLASSTALVGLMTKPSSVRPMRTAPTGPGKGRSERLRAQEAPISPRVSPSFSWSEERTSAVIMVSKRIDFSKSGRRLRSMRREERISFSLGRPSRLKKPPGIRPAA